MPVHTPTTVLMCRPTFFDVTYSINPWMSPENPTDTAAAISQWEELVAAYNGLGITTEFIQPRQGLDDMVFAANGAFVLDQMAYGAKFAVEQRIPEGPAYLERLEELGYRPVVPREVNEGEGDILLVGERILAGHGFRTSLEAHQELRDLFGREVLSLRLVDPRFYHLDTALTVLCDGGIAYYPAAFDDSSLATLERHFPDAIIASDQDACSFGLNSFGVGETMVVSPHAVEFAAQLRARGLTVHTVNLSELLLAGGGIKCCTLELRS